MRQSWLVGIAVVTGVLVTSRAEGCTCGSGGPPCAQVYRVAAAFAGKVISISGSSVVRFQILQQGRGVNTPFVDVISFPQNGANCGYTFEVGQSYVVYAVPGQDGQLTTSMCLGNKPLSKGADDIAYFRELNGPPRGARVFGRIYLADLDLGGQVLRYVGTGIGDARVTLTAATTTREATSGPDGAYEFASLVPGEYRVSVAPPPGFAVAGPPLPERERPRASATVKLAGPSHCGIVALGLRTESAIHGTLRTTNGVPAEDETIDLIALSNAASSTREIPHLQVRTDARGGFTFPFITPGQYLVGVNLKSPPPSSQLDRRLYYPGVARATEAAVITVTSGARVELDPFSLVMPPAARTITGVVRWNDGTLAPDAAVSLTGATIESVRLDAQGRFTLTLPYGARYYLEIRGSRLVDGRRVISKQIIHVIERELLDTNLQFELIPGP